MKSDNHTFIYFVGQYCCLTLDVNGFDKGWDLKNFMDLILPQWNICFKNITYMHHVAFYIWLLKRYKVSWTCIYKILWGSIFQGCYGHGKVVGKKLFSRWGKSQRKSLILLQSGITPRILFTLHSKSCKLKGLGNEDRIIDGLQKNPKQM